MIRTLLLAGAALALTSPALAAAKAAPRPASVALPAANPFAKPSALPFHAPDFARIKDRDYLPAMLAGMAAK